MTIRMTCPRQIGHADGAQADWVESWGGASLTEEARRKAWWKQAKKQHGELCAKHESFLEQLGESAHATIEYKAVRSTLGMASVHVRGEARSQNSFVTATIKTIYDSCACTVY